MTTSTKPGSTLRAALSGCRIGFGAMQLTDARVWGPPPDRTAAVAVLRRAVDLGVTFLDTADAYGLGANEGLLKEALYPYPPHLVIATKAGLTRPSAGEWIPLGRPEYIRQQAELSLRRLRADHIDLFQLHRVDPVVPLSEQVGALKQLQDEGKIRHAGLSNVTLDQVQSARETMEIVSVQNQYSVAARGADDVVSYCQRAGMTFIAWEPLGNGAQVRASEALREIAERTERSPAQVALAWLLHRSPCVLPIPGTRSLRHLEENVAAANLELTPQQLARLANT